MPIIESTYSANLQIDGRSYIRECHVDDAGAEHVVEYLAAADADTAEILALHAGQLTASEEAL